jgi:tetratricopeptide (TPR) repeat protein
MRLIPDAVALKLSENLEYLALTARICSESGEEVLAQKTFAQMLAFVNQRGEDIPANLQVEIVGLMLRFKRPGEAAQRMFKLTEQDPENVDAWEVLLAALVQNHQERSGTEALQRMPETVYNAGLSRPGFLRSVAAIQIAGGKLQDAEDALTKLAEQQKAKGSADAVGTELQLANVYLKEGRADKAEELLNELTDANPDNSDVWKAFSAMLHERHRDLEVLALRQRMPRKVAAHLMGDYDYLSVLASAQNAAGNPDGAMRVLNGAIAKARAADAAAPVSLQLQLSFLAAARITTRTCGVVFDSRANTGEAGSDRIRIQGVGGSLVHVG